MDQKNSITLRMPATIAWLNLVLIAFFAVLIIMKTIFTDGPHDMMYKYVTLCIFVPCSLIIVLTSLWRVKVNGSKITVRKYVFGRRSFDVSDIVKVNRLIVNTPIGKNEKMTVKTASTQFSVETLMKGSKQMFEFILANVDESKIEVVTSKDDYYE